MTQEASHRLHRALGLHDASTTPPHDPPPQSATLTAICACISCSKLLKLAAPDPSPAARAGLRNRFVPTRCYHCELDQTHLRCLQQTALAPPASAAAPPPSLLWAPDPVAAPPHMLAFDMLAAWPVYQAMVRLYGVASAPYRAGRVIVVPRAEVRKVALLEGAEVLEVRRLRERAGWEEVPVDYRVFFGDDE